MRLSYKLSLGVGLSLAVALGVDAVTTVHRSVAEYEADLLSHTAQQAHALSISVAKLWLSFGDAGATEVLGAANDVSPEVRAHWVNLRTLLNSTLELTDAEVGRLRQGLPVARLVGLQAPERAAVAFSPVVLDRQVYGVVQVSQLAVRRSELIRWHAERALATAAALLVIAGVCGSLLGMRWVASPVQKLVEKAARMGKGDFERPLRLDTRDEFEWLGQALNDAARELGASRTRLESETRARIDAVDQVRRADRLITVGRIAAGLAHELGTPIHVAMERAKMARQGEVEPADMPRTLDIIIEQTERIASTIRQVLDLARIEPPKRATVDLRLLLDSTRELLAPLALKKSIEIVTRGPERAPAPIDSGQIRQVIMNLVMNAIHAMNRPGTIGLRLSAEPAAGQANGSPGDWVIEVEDQGAGIAPEHLSKIFEPFFTTKPVGEGTGLGLSIVAGIVREHGGSIDVASVLGQGSTFRVRLPQGSPAEQSLQEAST
ncbi:MAG TPA: HAMP domain-containing sensor histidine kinase [Polyangiaceae bacterium]|nr:HAMP domain-containing sensor histidine kinase [Polyangiaceae bacterium]